MKKHLIISLFLAFISAAHAQQNEMEKGYNSITKDIIKAQMDFLASDWTKGREVGTPGAYMAADYIAAVITHPSA